MMMEDREKDQKDRKEHEEKEIKEAQEREERKERETQANMEFLTSLVTASARPATSGVWMGMPGGTSTHRVYPKMAAGDSVDDFLDILEVTFSQYDTPRNEWKAILSTRLDQTTQKEC